MAMQSHAIGVFDSGVGGLTVLKALSETLPDEKYIYLGDMARLPYGTKSAETVTQYALQAARMLMQYDIKMLVVACNSATALALPTLQKLLPHLPCLGVIEPSAKKAAGLSETGHIAVISTEGTARSGAYIDAIQHYRPNAKVKSLGCNLLVSLAEEGWCDGIEAEAVVSRYLRELGTDFDTLVLGCTHFPVLAPTLRKLLPSHIAIVDSATTTAEYVRDYLASHNLIGDAPHGTKTFLVTDSPERFSALAQRFLDSSSSLKVELVNLMPFEQDLKENAA